MNNALQFLNESDKKSVEQAIAEAEKLTSAEIVCAVATESGRYDRAEAYCGLLGSVISLGVLHWIVYQISVQNGGWEITAAPIGWQIAAVVFGFIAGNIKASYIHSIRRFFTSATEMDQEVERAASYIFRSKGLSRTEEGGGVLLYLSLFERRLYVLTDEGVQKVTGPEFAGELRDLAQAELRTNNRADALIKPVKRAAEALKESIPCKADDEDELSNEVILIHPRP